MYTQNLSLCLLFLISIPCTHAVSNCPWGRDPNTVELHTGCLCAINLSGQLSVQCSLVNFNLLTRALYQHARDIVIDLVYINNTIINDLQENTFKGLKISNLQISNAQMSGMSPNSFRGLEDTLQGLNLADNDLTEVPVNTLRKLRILTNLDLTNNKISFVPNNAFITLRLNTLKLSGNNITLAESSLSGLGQSLANLNLKGCQLNAIPNALSGLAGLQFLDLAQNNIRDLSRDVLTGLASLTALNLERNMIQKLDSDVFVGVNDTLSSLSLLNNLLTTYPTQAITSLTQLRVLDLGFNLVRFLPPSAFSGIKTLTLLALDGNPMATLSEDTFSHLNSSLRGLSLGGRFLTCDCKLSWVVRWIRDLDLQVTSRERDPQFCGNPPQLRQRSFYQINENDLRCTVPTSSPSPTTQSTTPLVQRNPFPTERLPPQDNPLPNQRRVQQTSINQRIPSPSVKTPTSDIRVPPPVVISSSPLPPRTSPSPHVRRPSPLPDLVARPRRPSPLPDILARPRQPSPLPDLIARPGQMADLVARPSQMADLVARPSQMAPPSPSFNVLGDRSPSKPGDVVTKIKMEVGHKPSESSQADLMDAVRKNTDKNHIAPEALVEDVIVKEAYKERNSIVIKWQTETDNILGFRVIYRLFGTPQFKQGPPLAPSEREFKIKNVPDNECIVVCVVSLEEVEISPSSVPFDQCREIRTEGVGGNKRLDNIIIPASTAIVVCVIVAVIIFIACLKTSNKKNKLGIDEKPIHTLSMSMNGLNLAGGPGGVHHPGAPLAGLASLGLGPGNHVKDWDQVSMYSQKTDRSVNRGRMYNMNHMQQGSVNTGYIPDDARSHISQMSTRSRSRSQPDDRREHGLFGDRAHRYHSKNDLRGSRQSLGDANRQSLARRSTRQSTRSRMSSRERSQRNNRDQGDRGSSGYRSRGSRDDGDSLPDSDNWATSTDNNWTDYDQEMYTVRSPQKNRYNSRDDVNL